MATARKPTVRKKSVRELREDERFVRDLNARARERARAQKERDSRAIFGTTAYRPKRAKIRVKVVTVVKDRDLQAEAVESLPPYLKKSVKTIIADPDLALGVREMFDRLPDFKTPMEALLAGIGIVPEARRIVDDSLDAHWASTAIPRTRVNEVIVGAGLHAAVYAATRVASGFSPPLVLERRERVGGVFAISRGPSFYLNSRNRPGPLLIPGERDGSLNFLPNAPVQASHLSGDEYQTNDVLAWVIRLTLALNARVVTGVEVIDLRSRNERAPGGPYGSQVKSAFVYYNRDESRRTTVKTGRAILADGLTNARDSTGLRALCPERIFSFEGFMSRMDSPFPLKGMERVAVLGNGDSAKTAIEALTGKGPRASMSVAALDYPRKITWFGASYTNCADWQARSRPRYLAIGDLLPKANGSPGRVEPRAKASTYGLGYETVLVNEMPYDYVIDCTGYRGGTLGEIGNEYSEGFGRAVAYYDGSSCFRVGPALGLIPNEAEQAILKGIAENSTSSFRYASRTATLAAALKEVDIPARV